MSYHPLINGNNRQKITKNTAFVNEHLAASRNGQRHVTFREINHSPGKLNDSQKTKYHFTYGQPSHEGSFISHSKVAYNNQFSQANNFSKIPLQSSQNRLIQEKISDEILRGRSSSSKKKKLRIFPQKYQNKALLSTGKDNKSTQIKQIAELKSQIQRLRQQITSLSMNFSKNTSRDFTESLYRNEAGRTKRLSELNEFNQKLYHQLALKLKEISLEEYENVLQINNSNKKFLDSVYSSAGKERAYQTVGYENAPDHHKFMDIQQFEKEYQERYSQPASSPNKPLELEKSDDKGEIQSPFLIKENTLEGDGFKTMKSTAPKNLEKRQAFTFHKKHAQKPYNATKPAQKLTDPAKQSQPKAFEIDTHTKQKRQLHDINRELENKIMRKRSASEYAYLTKTRKY